MAEIKFGWALMQALGYTTYLYSLLLTFTGQITFGNVKDVVIWIAGLVFITIKAKVAWLKYQKEKYDHEQHKRMDEYEWKQKDRSLTEQSEKQMKDRKVGD